jgi:hypothetical protein
MSNQPLIVEGAWEDVSAIGERYADRRMRLIIMPSVEEPSAKPNAPTIEDEIAAIWSGVTDEQWASLPPDLSDQLDHYIYGTPKR